MSLPVTLLSLIDVRALTWDGKSNTKKQNNIWFITVRLKKDICNCSISLEPRGFWGNVGSCQIVGRTTESLTIDCCVWLGFVTALMKFLQKLESLLSKGLMLLSISVEFLKEIKEILVFFFCAKSIFLQTVGKKYLTS